MHHRALAASFAAAQRRSAGARFASTEVPRKALVTASLNGVLTDPKKWPQVPVTPEAMALEAARAYEAGATVVRIHLRDQRPGKGHLPSWDPAVAADVCDAIRARSPVLINLTTGTMGAAGSPLGGGALGPTAGPIACLERVRPAMAALNAGSLNYLRTKADGSWAWPPLLFDNPVSKIQTMAEAMSRLGIVPECECFDTGIVRSLRMFESNGFLKQPYQVSFVMGVASGMPANAKWLPLLIDELGPGVPWQVIAIGRHTEVWPLLAAAARLGGNVRTGLEDTFQLPDGRAAQSSGDLVRELVETVLIKGAGRFPMSMAETRAHFGL